MRLSGQLTEAEARAAARFNADYVLGLIVNVIGKYGLVLQMASAVGRCGGTPISQMTGEAAARLNPQERKAHHAIRHANACTALRDAEVARWLTPLLAEETLPGAAKPISLADIGTVFINYSGKQQGAAAGAALVRFWLQILVRHYGFEDRRQRP